MQTTKGDNSKSKMMRQTEINMITPLLDKIKIPRPVGYKYSYGEKKIVLYANVSDEFINEHARDVETLRNIMIEQRMSNLTIELVAAKDNFSEYTNHALFFL